MAFQFLDSSLLTISFIVALSFVVHYINSKHKSLKFLRGPPSLSWTFGNEYELARQTESGEIEDPWVQEYGLVFRFASFFGRETLFVSDPKALQHILHNSRYHYPKINGYRNDNHRIFGKSVVTVEGKAHQRQRKVLNHAFSISELKTFLPLFQRSTTRLIAKWQERYFLKDSNDTTTKALGLNSSEYEVIDILGWLFRFALDVIGQAAFEYNFGALDEDDNVLTQILRHMNDDSFGPGISKSFMFLRGLRRQFLVDPVFWNPFNPEVPFIWTKEDKRFNHWLSTVTKTAETIFQKKAESKIHDIDEGNKDILSVLVRSNSLEDPSKRLDDTEVLHQMGTIILGGHETIAITSSWLLYELSRHPEHQERVLKEIKQVKKHKADGESFTWSDYDSMTFSNACIKEALRLYPVIVNMFRYADCDDIIPLSDPIISASGERLTEIPVRKWQRIRVNVSNYHRLQSVWGPDADTWNPERHINDSLKKETTLGVFANLLSFSGGVRACIGWRFALMEMQTILTELVSVFEFSIDPNLDIFITAQGAAAPVVRGKEDEGIQMPLKVRPRQNSSLSWK
ncbi:cytochrome P450 [Dendrothele bispora CBS 962.96]|uniref:Cytochrome P450 n=1 Tax=Dendrothele bispora (strain CBS 962.96) TaxID=1314807 RepID=A0A4S8LQA4_DENBC|nr:cytochrome P450 [Dendrothele bispora CBS 962.96]